MKISFLGATGTVTGSKYLIESASRRILVDCGLFQGFKQLRLHNWQPLPIRAGTIDAVILTHAHIDHSGYLPLLVRQGYPGRVHCTPGTRDLLEVLLRDSAYLQEEEARFANKHGYSKHHPALPLYTQEDAAAALKRVSVTDFERDFGLAGDVTCRFTVAGHMLGASIVHLTTPEGRVVFAGDLGRPHDPIMQSPGIPAAARHLAVESTYGDRTHPTVDSEAESAEPINAAAGRGGVIVIPAFAVGRAQMILHFIGRLKRRGAIPDLPVFLNGPMAAAAMRIYLAHQGEYRLSPAECAAMAAVATVIDSVEESKALNLRADRC